MTSPNFDYITVLEWFFAVYHQSRSINQAENFIICSCGFGVLTTNFVFTVREIHNCVRSYQVSGSLHCNVETIIHNFGCSTFSHEIYRRLRCSSNRIIKNEIFIFLDCFYNKSLCNRENISRNFLTTNFICSSRRSYSGTFTSSHRIIHCIRLTFVARTLLCIKVVYCIIPKIKCGIKWCFTSRTINLIQLQ